MATHAKTNVTFADGTTAQSSDTVYVRPDRQRTTDDFADLVPGMNGPFLADVLSAYLMHERCGRALYRSVAGRTHNPMLKRRYQQFGEETADHIRILEDVITELGGDPHYISPAARAVKAMDDKTLEATFLLAGSIDLMTLEMVMLDAVVVAETLDHANWSDLATLVDSMEDGAGKRALEQAVAQVEPEEDEHLEWARSTRREMARLQASSEAVALLGATAEEAVAQIRSLFQGGS